MSGGICSRMIAAKSHTFPCVLLLMALWSRSFTAAQYVPPSCKAVCEKLEELGGNIREVKKATDEFFTINPFNSTPGSTFLRSRASTWAVVLLKTVRLAVPAPRPGTQSVTMTPPAVARLLGIYSLAVYQAYAVWSENLFAYGRYFAPLTWTMVNLNKTDPAAIEKWTRLTVLYADVFPGNFAPSEPDANAAQEAAISGAASQFILLMFCNNNTEVPTNYWCLGSEAPPLPPPTAEVVQGAKALVKEAMDFVGKADELAYPAAFKQGVEIATEFFEQFRMLDLLRDNINTLPPDLKDIPSSSQQTKATVHNCSQLHKGYHSWQPLRVPRFNPWNYSIPQEDVFPPTTYKGLVPPTPGCATCPFNVTVQFYRGHAAQNATPALVSTTASMPLLMEGLRGPPTNMTPDDFAAAMQEVLDESAALDDVKKVIAEFWADGPDSTTPPGHWFKIAIEESNNNAQFTLDNINVLDSTVWATVNVGMALHEAGNLAWRLKAQYMGSRPITGIQCGPDRVDRAFSAPARNGTAWRGPYLGVGTRNLNEWQPFQTINFTTPPFSGYVSGHATFSAAAAEALAQLRIGQNTSFIQLGYNCYKTPRGSSTVEPMILYGKPGFRDHYTNKPNKGPLTRGYSPARSITMCWKTYEEAAQQAADSRMYGGIHIKIDNDDGLKLGKRIGSTVAAFFAQLSPSNFRVKTPVSTKPKEFGAYNDKLRKPDDLLCPPGTFVRVFDGRADSKGLYALGLTCSDGTFVGSVGYWGVGGENFVVEKDALETDGFEAIQAGVVLTGVFNCLDTSDKPSSDKPSRDKPCSSVVSIAFKTTQDDNFTTPIGNTNAATAVEMRNCTAGEHIVGLTIFGDSSAGNIGSFGMCCYNRPADTTYRRAAVPANPVSWKWTYNWQCPEGMYITRFFGLASAYINTLNAQCARSWNLKEVGLAFASPTASNYSHTSLNGFEGIIIKGFSGGVDSIQLISARTKKLSAIFGAPNAFGPASTLQCEPGTVIVGIHGRQDAFVSSIGITCGSGPFRPLPKSVSAVNLGRNPRPPVRIPGGNIIPLSVLETKPLSDILPPERLNIQVAGSVGKTQPSIVLPSQTTPSTSTEASGDSMTDDDAQDYAGDAQDDMPVAPKPVKDAVAGGEKPGTAPNLLKLGRFIDMGTSGSSEQP